MEKRRVDSWGQQRADPKLAELFVKFHDDESMELQVGGINRNKLVIIQIPFSDCTHRL